MRGMLLANTPKIDLRASICPNEMTQKQEITGLVKVQVSKALLFSLDRLALRSQLTASCPALIYLGAPLGLTNPSLKFFINSTIFFKNFIINNYLI